jgi:K+-transporting ATPase ATPase C chain
MKYVMPAIRFKIFMTVLLGLIYPFAMTGMSQVMFSRQASGDFISRGGQAVGSRLISQKFERPEYFWSRPSGVDYNPLPSGGSNLGQTSSDLKKAVDERRAKLKAAHPEQAGEPPQDLLFASGSGLDPHISPEAAWYQASRVAKARNLTNEQVQHFIEQASEGRQLGILGEPTVNVLVLNLAMDKAQGIESAPQLMPTPTTTPVLAPTAPENTTPSAPVETK